MRKKNKHVYKTLKMPVLYREDLRLIEDIITQDLKADKYTLETNEYEFNTVSDIPRDTDPSSEFNISILNPYISIRLSRKSASVFALSDDISSVGAVAKFHSVLQKRERSILYWFIEIISWVILPLNIAVFLLARSRGELDLIFGITFGFLSLLGWILYFYYRLYSFSKVYFIYSQKRLTFWHRNRDALIVDIILAAVAVLFGIIQTIFLTPMVS